MRGVAGMTVVPPQHRCARCKTRYKQHADGLCRSCHRAGQVTNPVQTALATLRHFIDKQRMSSTLEGDERRFIEARRQINDAQNALELLAERLRQTEDR